MNPDYLIVPVHDLKTNLSNYIKLLELKQKRGIVVRRYKKHVAILLLIERPK